MVNRSNSQLPTSKSQTLAAAYKVHNLNLIALANDDLGEAVALDDREVVLDGNPPRVDLQPLEQRHDRQGLIDFEGFAVQGDVHEPFLVSGFSRTVSTLQQCRIERFDPLPISTPR